MERRHEFDEPRRLGRRITRRLEVDEVGERRVAARHGRQIGDRLTLGRRDDEDALAALGEEVAGVDQERLVIVADVVDGFADRGDVGAFVGGEQRVDVLDRDDARMYRVLLKANKAVKRAIEKGAIVLADRVLRRLMTLYDGIVSLGLAFHEQQPPLIKRPGARGRQARRPGHNLLIRLRNFKDDVLRFASNFAVPFTNNQAEQDSRMMKVKMKISGGFRSQAGAEAFAALRSVISTARKQRWDILKTLSSPPNTLIAAFPA